MSVHCHKLSSKHSTALAMLFAGLLIISSATVAFPQGGVGSTRGLPGSAGGVHTIQGRIFFPSGRAATQFRVRLESNVSGSNASSSNLDGSFTFQSLVAGTYAVVIDAGPDYEPVRETVTIYGTSGYEGRVAPQTVFVPVNLRMKGAPDPLAAIPKSARESYARAMEAVHGGDNKKAIELLNKSVAAAPDFVPALDELGIQLLKQNQLDKASEVLQKAVKLAPNEFNPHLHYGIVLLNKKEYMEAETELRRALQLNNAAPTGHMYLGITLLSLSRDEKTKQFNAEKYAEAQQELETAVASGKEETAQAHRYLGGIYWGNKDYKRAADEFDVYLKLQPKAVDADRIRTAVKELRGKQ